MAGLACPAKPWRGRVPPSTFFLGREAKTWPLMQTTPPSRIMLGGAALNPDSEIPRQLSVCGGAIRFNGRRQLRRPYSSVLRCALETPRPRSGPPNWRYHMIFISSSTRSFFEGICAFPASSCSPSRPRRRRGSTRPSRCGWSPSAGRGVEVRTQVTVKGREPHKFRLNCRRTATASLFLVPNRTSHSTRIPVWISLLKPGVGGSKFYPRWPQGANACGISCATVGLCSEARAEALSGKYSDAMV